jgi:hypothetical protein
MLNTTIQPAQMWTTIQEPIIASSVPNSYLLVLSAMDNGWHIGKVELVPSWDQHGLVYLVTLHLYTSEHSQQLIVPKNPFMDSLLDNYNVDICSRRPVFAIAAV